MNTLKTILSGLAVGGAMTIPGVSGAVHHACLLNGLAAGSRAAKAVHAHSEEDGSSSLCVDVENIADYCVLCYFHCCISFHLCIAVRAPFRCVEINIQYILYHSFVILSSTISLIPAFFVPCA